MKYTITLESDNAEKDIKELVDVVMTAVERYAKISNDSMSRETAELKCNVKDIDTRIDGLEAKVKSFCEVDLKKKLDK